jgi:colanic acid/amylovoran biosynthesis glycosyltransferase
MVKLGCPKEKILLHYHGSDAKRFLFPQRSYAANESLKVLICARLAPKKGHHVLFDAVAKFSKFTKWKIQLIVVGEGPLKHPLMSLAENLNIQHLVTFRGHIPYASKQLEDEYRNADIFILPSVTSFREKEGIPGTLIEAMASGLPVVSTRHAGIPEVITDRVNGLLVNENDMEGIVKALIELSNDPILRSSLGREAASTAASCLDLSSRTAELENIYDQLISARKYSADNINLPRLSQVSG